MSVIGINGSFIRKPASGMGQVSWHFIKQLIKMSSENKHLKSEFVIYLEDKIPSDFISDYNKVPANIKFKIVKSRLYKRDDLIRKVLWEKFWLPVQVKKDNCQSFLSLYQSASILPKQIKHTMFVHDVIPNVFPEYLNNLRKKSYYWLVDRAVKQTYKIVTNSNFSKKEIARTYNINHDKIKVSHLSCDPIFKKQLSEDEREDDLKKYGIKKSDKFILYEGGSDVRKNIGRIIEAYGRLVPEITNIPSLVIVGSFHKYLVPLVTDIEEKIIEISSNYNVDRKLFKTVGFVEQEDLPALFQSAEIFIYPSLYEGFGMPVLEAMTSSTPVVTSNTTSIPEVISQEAGYLVNNPEDIDEIKTQLKKALTDSEENQSKKIALALQESKKFTWEKFVNKILEQ